jgi:hypothetical protein
MVQDGYYQKTVMNHLGNAVQILQPRMSRISDPMSKGCQQHGPLGEATLHPERWDCVGCVHKPKDSA